MGEPRARNRSDIRFQSRKRRSVVQRCRMIRRPLDVRSSSDASKDRATRDRSRSHYGRVSRTRTRIRPDQWRAGRLLQQVAVPFAFEFGFQFDVHRVDSLLAEVLSRHRSRHFRDLSVPLANCVRKRGEKFFFGLVCAVDLLDDLPSWLENFRGRILSPRTESRTAHRLLRTRFRC